MSAPWLARAAADQQARLDRREGVRRHAVEGDDLGLDNVGIATDSRGQIRVDERVPEPLLAVTPVDEQVLDEEGCRDHPDPVVHVPGQPELAHAGIDDRDSGAPSLPRGELDRVHFSPRKFGKRRLQRFFAGMRKVKEQVMRKITPSEFAQEGLGQFALPRGGAAQALRDLARADFAEVQMRRQARCALFVGPVAPMGVVLQCGLDETIEHFPGPLGAWRESRVQALVPVDAWQQLQRFQRATAKAMRRQSVRRRQRFRQRPLPLQGAPERREHAVRVAVAGGDRPRLVQQVRLVALRVDARLPQ